MIVNNDQIQWVNLPVSFRPNLDRSGTIQAIDQGRSISYAPTRSWQFRPHSCPLYSRVFLQAPILSNELAKDKAQRGGHHDQKILFSLQEFHRSLLWLYCLKPRVSWGILPKREKSGHVTKKILVVFLDGR